MGSNGKEVVDEGKDHLPKEVEPQKGAKAAKTTHTRSSSKGSIVERGHDRQIEVAAWNPSFVLDGTPLSASSSIRDFQQGKAGYMVDAVEQALLLPGDMSTCSQ